VLKAYLQPLMEGYLTSLEERLLATGYTHGVLTVASSGGMMTTDTARRLPIRTIFSGPAGGVSQACFLGAAAGVRDFITYDMGGTSTDVCLVRDLQPLMTADATVGAFPVKVSQIDMHTVGAGGGSIAWLDVDGGLAVGPRSAGAVPGPAAYGQGGSEATVTDANVVLGRIGSRRRLGGSIAIDAERARQAISHLAARLERPMSAEALAEGVVTIAVARMTSAIREISIQRGHDPRDFTLIAFGGAGPMHALAIAEEIGIPRVLVPRHPGNFSALGLLAADIKHDDVRTRVGPLGERLPALREAFAEMETAARRQLEREGFAPENQRLLRSLDLRYRGQAFELNVALRGAAEGEPSASEREATGAALLAAIEADFHRQHRDVYGHANPGAAVELVNARLTAYGLVPKPASERPDPAGATLEAALVERRPVWFGGRAHDCPVWDRERLPERAALQGPAIVEEFGATTVVPPGWRGETDEHGNLRFDRPDRP
jgi:N-methylhydantoinase A